jgi:hypothetical protein
MIHGSKKTLVNLKKRYMEKKFYPILFLLVFGTGIFEGRGQSLVLQAKDGTESTTLLGQFQNLTFTSTDVSLKTISGSSSSFALSTIRKIYFNGVATAINEIPINENKQSITISPNPVEELVNLGNVPVGTYDAYIYQLDGSIVGQAEVSSTNPSINVSGLHGGIYILRMNKQTIKFIKL